jgi:Helix-turn-helix domain
MVAMSTKIMLEVARHSTAKGNAKLVLLLLASYAHPDGTHAEMSLSTIAREAGLSRRQVNTIVHFLAETGHVYLESAAGAHGTNRYAVQRPWGKEGNHFPRATTSPGAITAPLGQPLPTIDKENINLKKQSDEAIALGKPLPQEIGQPLPHKIEVSPTPVVTTDAAYLVGSYGLGANFLQVLQGKDPDIAEEVNTVHTLPPTPPSPKPAFNTTRFYLGALCPAHPYGDTGQTQRLRKDETCYGCFLAAKKAAWAVRQASPPP